MTKKTPSPADLYAEANALKEAWIAKEGEAIRAALVASDWFEQPAARLLGMNRSTLKRLITEGGRHPTLGAEAAEKRAATGYKGGNPKLPHAPR